MRNKGKKPGEKTKQQWRLNSINQRDTDVRHCATAQSVRTAGVMREAVSAGRPKQEIEAETRPDDAHDDAEDSPSHAVLFRVLPDVPDREDSE